MSDWKSRATPVSDWKTRATPVGEPHASAEEINALDDAARGESTPGPEAQSAPSAGMTALQSYGDKATFGAAAPIGAAGQALALKLTGDPSSFSDLYREGVKQNRGDLARGAEEHPTASRIGSGLGIGATMLLPAGAAARGVGAATKAAVGYGAAYGGIGGLAGGQGVANLDAGQAAKDAAIGAGAGAAGGAVLGPAAYAVGKGISPVARYIGGKLENLADSSALKAIGLIGSNVRTLRRQNPELPERVAASLQSEGIIKPFGKVEDNVERLLAQREIANRGVGQAADTVQTQLDAKLAEQSARLGSGNPLDVLQAGRAGIANKFSTGDLAAGVRNARGVLEETPGVTQASLDAIRQMEESIARGGATEMGLRQANQLKSSLQEQAQGAYRAGVQSQVTRAMKAVPAAAREQVLTTAGQVPGGREALEAALARATPLNAVGEMAADRASMLTGHSSIGHIGGQVLGGVVGGMVGGAAHSTLGLPGVALALGQKGLRQRASSLGAVGGLAGADAMSRVAEAGETPVARYIAGLLSGGTKRLSPELEAQGGATAAGGGNSDERHP